MSTPHLIHDPISQRAVRIALPYPPIPIDITLMDEGNPIADGKLPDDLDRLKTAHPNFSTLLDRINDEVSR